MEKITEPVKLRLNVDKKTDVETAEAEVLYGEEKDSMSGVLKAASFGALGSIIALIGMLYYKKSYKKTP